MNMQRYLPEQITQVSASINITDYYAENGARKHRLQGYVDYKELE